MQVAIFEKANREDLEKAINEFLQINAVKICHVTQSQSENQHGEHIVIISMFYEDYE